MSPYTTPRVVNVSGSNARADSRGCGGAVIGAGSATSAILGSTEGPAKIRCRVEQTQVLCAVDSEPHGIFREHEGTIYAGGHFHETRQIPFRGLALEAYHRTWSCSRRRSRSAKTKPATSAAKPVGGELPVVPQRRLNEPSRR